jgi:hypothetical protein
MYVPSMCFDLYKVIIREVYTNTYKYSKFCERCAHVELKHNIDENF